MTTTSGISWITAGNAVQDTSSGRAQKTSAETTATDSVDISSAADAASAASRIAAQDTTNEVRKEAVERARKQIQEGAYRVQEAVLRVASHVGRLL